MWVWNLQLIMGIYHNYFATLKGDNILQMKDSLRKAGCRQRAKERLSLVDGRKDDNYHATLGTNGILMPIKVKSKPKDVGLKRNNNRGRQDEIIAFRWAIRGSIPILLSNIRLVALWIVLFAQVFFVVRRSASLFFSVLLTLSIWPASIIAGVGLVASLKIFLSTSFSTSGGISILHQVPEGHVGAYWRGGALLKDITDPGFHLKLPLITQFEPIQVTLQTDQVRDIPCGTKGGVMISFDKIEVVNRLHKRYVYDTLLSFGVDYDKTWIYDKIHHEINQFCSSHTLQQVYIDMFDQIDDKMKEALQRDCTIYAPGVEIISVRVTKPNIPEKIKCNFELMEEERTKALIAIEAQKVKEKEAETQKKIAVSEAEKNALVSKIIMEQKLTEKNSAKQEEAIENEMYLARAKSQADASFYKVMKEAEANKLKLTPEFLELKFIEAIANNSKIFFGEKVPNMVFDQRLLGNFLHAR